MSVIKIIYSIIKSKFNSYPSENDVFFYYLASKNLNHCLELLKHNPNDELAKHFGIAMSNFLKKQDKKIAHSSKDNKQYLGI